MKKILIVDDEPDVELLMKQRFRRQIRDNTFTLLFARNGVEALEILNKDPEIRMVISDINMPEMDGLTLLDRIHKELPDVIAIIVSAYGDMNNIRTAMNRGAFDFVTKPINFEDLNLTIDKTLIHIQQLIDAEKTKSRLENILYELHVARDIQQSILPKEFINSNQLSLFAKMTAAKEVGGDFYDFFWLDKDRLGFLIADVSGKGVPAALFMSVSRTLIRAHAFNNLSAGACLKEVNNVLEKTNANMMFVTCFYGILNVATGEFNYANGGHNPPMIIRASGEIEVLAQTDGVALGIMEVETFIEKNAKLNPNDLLYLYTDGVTEAMNDKGVYYGENALKEKLKDLKGETPESLLGKVEANVNAFANGCPQSDDITMLAIRYLLS